MHFHHYSLKALAQALTAKHQGEKVLACFTQNKDEIVIELESGVLRVGCHTPLTYLVPFPEFARAKRNVVNLFPEILELKIIDFAVVPQERIMLMNLSEGFQFIFKLHGPASNAILRQEEETVALFKKQQTDDSELVVAAGEWNEAGFEAHPVMDESSVMHALRTISPIFERKFARAVLAKMQQESDFGEIARKVILEAQTPKWYIGKEQNRIRFMLFAPEDSDSVPVEGIIPALQLFIRAYYQYAGYRQMYGATERAISKPYKKLQRTYESYLKNIHILETDRNPEEIGHLLMANLHAIEANLKVVELDDFYNGEKIKIKLDPRLNPQENAKRYYGKHKQRRGKLKYLKEQVEELEERLLEGEEQQEVFQSLVPPDEMVLALDGFDYSKINTLRKLYKVLHKSGETGGQKRIPYRTFKHQSYEIFVGKGAVNNDQLSFKFANKEDIWMHAKDVAGSHVIIRKRPGHPVPMDVLEYAASLAAYYSKRKTDSLVPVQYTTRKYVRKRKGDPPGLVVVEREEVIMVVPGK